MKIKLNRIAEKAMRTMNGVDSTNQLFIRSYTSTFLDTVYSKTLEIMF